MNILNKVTLQSLRKNRTRTIVTIIGVILSASMITAVTTFISSLQNFMVQDEIARSGDWHVEFMDVDSSFVRERMADRELKNAAVTQNIGYAILEGSVNTFKPYLYIAGFSEEAFDIMPVQLLSGRLPQSGNEIILSEHIETNGGVSFNIGDTLTLPVGKRMLDGHTLNQFNGYQGGGNDGGTKETFVLEITKTYTVVGIFQRPGFESFSAPGYTVITRIDSHTLGESAHYNVLTALRSPRSVYDYAQITAGNYGYRFNSDLLRFMGISNLDNFNIVLYSLGSILIALIMIGSILLIYNSFAISVSERSRQFGILSSVGATGKQLRKSVLFEGACVGVVGIPLGIIAGIGGIGVTLGVVGGFFTDMVTSGTPLLLSVSIPAVVIAAVVGILTILLSAYIPAKRAAKRSAIDSIRQSDDIKIKAKALKTSKLTQRLFDLEGTLALKNFKRNKKRYRSTVISLFVSVVLFVSASSFGMFLQKGVAVSISDYGYDLAFSSLNMESEAIVYLYERLKNVSGVYESGYCVGSSFLGGRMPAKLLSDRYKEHYNIDSQTETYRLPGIIYFIDDETYLGYLRDLRLPIDEYTGSDARLVAVAREMGFDYENGRFVSFDIFENRNDLALQIMSHDSLNYVDAAHKDIIVTFADTMPSAISQTRHSGLIVFAPYSMRDEFHLDQMYPMLTFLSSKPMASAAEMETVIKDAGITSGNYSLYNVAEMMESQRNIILVINIFTYGFVILISLITIANVFNTVSTSINLRRREFAMLRSVGMTDNGFNRMMNYECIFYGLKALLFGLPAAITVSYLIYKSVIAGAEVPFSLPWSSIGISVFSVFFIVFITMLYAMGKIKKANVIDALRDDMA